MWLWDFNPHTVTDLGYILRVTFWVSLGVAVLVGLPEAALQGWKKPDSRRLATGLFCLVTLTCIGAISGYLSGLSRVSVVGQVIPAVLSLVGGFAIYLFGVKKVDSLFLPGSILAFALALAVALSEGANKRVVATNFGLMQEKCFDFFMNPSVLEPEKLETAQVMFGDACKTVISATRRNAFGQ